jgi:enamine deaminase RidA (YjgF/YER057c/UK114 family)
MKPQNRRSIFKKMFAGFLGITGASVAANATPNSGVDENGKEVFSGATKFAGMVFVAGKGAHFEGDIKAHTDHVLKELEKELIKAGSSMEKVLKVNVYLADLGDYKQMNEVFKGRFGPKPPVRTTVATYGGVPGNSLVEMDCIAIAN